MLYTEYASNSKDHIDEPDSQGVQLASVLKYLSQQQAPEQFEGSAGIPKLLLVQNKTRSLHFRLFIKFEVFLENGAGSWRLTAETRSKPVETRSKPVETRRKPAAPAENIVFLENIVFSNP